MQLQFSKMHGLGNDFMVVDLVTQHWVPEPAQVSALADRRTGIGFDQLLLIEPPTDPTADFFYRILNADGTEAEMCGNGVRCVGKFVQQRQLSRKTEITLQTNSGHVSLCVGSDNIIIVTLVEPRFELAQIPLAMEHLVNSEVVDHRVELETAMGRHRFVPVNVQNPHAVLFVESVQNAPVAELGPLIERHPAFPERVNVGFCEVVDRKFLRLRVFERGVGETRACGTGAAAATAAARLTGQTDDQIKVSLTGGKLRMAWQGPGTAITMAGPASFVYDGQLQV